MAVLEGRFTVRDLDVFMTAYADFRPVRIEMGVTGCRVMGDVDHPDRVVAILELPSVDAARAYATDPRRQDALRRAGVVTSEDVFLDELRAVALL